MSSPGLAVHASRQDFGMRDLLRSPLYSRTSDRGSPVPVMNFTPISSSSLARPQRSSSPIASPHQNVQRLERGMGVLPLSERSSSHSAFKHFPTRAIPPANSGSAVMSPVSKIHLASPGASAPDVSLLSPGGTRSRPKNIADDGQLSSSPQRFDLTPDGGSKASLSPDCSPNLFSITQRVDDLQDVMKQKFREIELEQRLQLGNQDQAIQAAQLVENIKRIADAQIASLNDQMRELQDRVSRGEAQNKRLDSLTPIALLQSEVESLRQQLSKFQIAHDQLNHQSRNADANILGATPASPYGTVSVDHVYRELETERIFRANDDERLQGPMMAQHPPRAEQDDKKLGASNIAVHKAPERGLSDIRNHLVAVKQDSDNHDTRPWSVAIGVSSDPSSGMDSWLQVLLGKSHGFRVEDSVKVKAGLPAGPRYGWAGVTLEDHGKVVELRDKDTIIVDFDGVQGWHAHPSDLQACSQRGAEPPRSQTAGESLLMRLGLAASVLCRGRPRFAVGDRVRRDHADFAHEGYGSGALHGVNHQLCGTVSAIGADHTVYVDFPGVDGWAANPKELILCKKCCFVRTHSHELLPDIRETNMCNICQAVGTAFRCPSFACDYDVCDSCWSRHRVFACGTSSHQHAMGPDPRHTNTCNMCSKVGTAFRCSEPGCDYDLCESCRWEMGHSSRRFAWRYADCSELWNHPKDVSEVYAALDHDKAAARRPVILRSGDVDSLYATAALALGALAPLVETGVGEGRPAVLLRREVMVKADETCGRLPVITLAFAVVGGGEIEGLRFGHGDAVKVCVPNYKPKSYSCSFAQPGEFHITTRGYGGRSSGFLHRLEVGSEIRAFAHGKRQLNGCDGRLVGLVAYGVGITECLPVAEVELEKPEQEVESVVLLWAARCTNETWWEERLERLKQRHKRLKVVYIFSRERREIDNCLHGRVDAGVLQQVFDERWGTALGGKQEAKRSRVRFCITGTKEMIRATSALLKSELRYDMPKHALLAKPGGDASTSHVQCGHYDPDPSPDRAMHDRLRAVMTARTTLEQKVKALTCQVAEAQDVTQQGPSAGGAPQVSFRSRLRDEEVKGEEIAEQVRRLEAVAGVDLKVLDVLAQPNPIGIEAPPAPSAIEPLRKHDLPQPWDEVLPAPTASELQKQQDLPQPWDDYEEVLAQMKKFGLACCPSSLEALAGTHGWVEDVLQRAEGVDLVVVLTQAEMATTGARQQLLIYGRDANLCTRAAAFACAYDSMDLKFDNLACPFGLPGAKALNQGNSNVGREQLRTLFDAFFAQDLPMHRKAPPASPPARLAAASRADHQLIHRPRTGQPASPPQPGAVAAAPSAAQAPVIVGINPITGRWQATQSPILQPR